MNYHHNVRLVVCACVRVCACVLVHYLYVKIVHLKVIHSNYLKCSTSQIQKIYRIYIRASIWILKIWNSRYALNL